MIRGAVLLFGVQEIAMNHRVFVSSCAALAVVVAGCGLKEQFPERAIFVANGMSSSVSVIDPVDGRVVGEIALDEGFHPHHMAISPDGTKLVIAAPNADLSQGHGDHAHDGAASKVYVIDSSNGDQKGVLDVAATVHNAAFLDDFSTMALGMMEHGMIAGYGVDKLDEQWTTEVGADPLEVTLVSGNRIVVANAGDGTLSILDGATHSVTDTTEVGQVPTAVWSTPSGLFVSLEGDKKVAILSSGNLGEVTGSYDVGGVPGQVASGKSGGDVWIAVEDRGVVEVRDPSNGEVTHTVEVGGKPHGVLVDQSAGLVYVTDEVGGRVVRIDAATYEVKDEIAVGESPNGIVLNGL